MILIGYQRETATTKLSGGAVSGQNTIQHMKRWSLDLRRSMSSSSYLDQSQKVVASTASTLSDIMNRVMFVGQHMLSRLQTGYRGGIG